MRLAVLAFALVACTEPPPPAATTIDLGAPTATPLTRIPLVPVALATQADFDALEDGWLPRRDAGDLVAALSALADAQSAPDPLLLQRIAVLLGDNVTSDGRGIQPLLDASARLRDRAPDDPHTLWLAGYVLYESLTRRGRLDIGGEGRALAEVIVSEWDKLRARAPNYVGPRGWTMARVRAALERVKAGLAEAAAAAPTAPAVAPRAATPAELVALSQLESFRMSNEGERRGICRDWRKRPASAQPTAAELRMDLGCAIEEGAPKRALEVIGALAASDRAAFDACGALAQLADRVTPKALEAARQAQPLTLDCP